MHTGTPSTYTPGFCKKPQVIKAKCNCIGPQVIPGFCVDGVFTPGRPPVVLPGKHIPKRYTPGSCTLFHKDDVSESDGESENGNGDR